MNNYDSREKSYCYFHPTEITIGVCHLCLNERLIVLSSDQTHHLYRPKSRSFNGEKINPPATGTSLPKIFSISSLLNRFEFRHRKFDEDFSDDGSSSHEDSFISIKFESNNGVGSWEKGSNKECNLSWNHSNGSTKTVVEHIKPPLLKLRWHKRIGHLFQLSKWKKSNKASVCHVGGKLEGAKVRNSGWIRSLTKRRTKE